MVSFNRAARFARLVTYSGTQNRRPTVGGVSIGPRVSRGW